MSYRLKQLDRSDVGRLRALGQLFQQAFDDADGSLPDQPGAAPDSHLEALLAKPHFIALVALEGNQVIGGLTAYELEKLDPAGRELYLFDLAVAEPHRRKGIATELINELRRVAAIRGAHLIFVQAEKGDEAAIALYRSLGSGEEVLHFNIAAVGQKP